MNRENFVWASIVAPITVPFVIVIVQIVAGVPNLDLILGLTFIGATIVSYTVFFLVGLPTIFILKKYDALRPRNVTIAGAFAGSLIGFAFLLSIPSEEEMPLFAKILVVFSPALYGLVVSGIFSALALRSTEFEDI